MSYPHAWTASLLPGNATAWMLALEGVDAALVAADPVGLVVASRSAARAPAAWLPYLAMERSVIAFDTGWSDAQQRAVVAGSFAMHRVMGTRPALNLALSQLGLALQVQEWFETSPQASPYTFTIHVTPGSAQPWTVASFWQVVRVANRAKNAHTLLTAIATSRALGPAPVYSAGALMRSRKVLIAQPLPPPTPAPPGVTPSEIDRSLRLPLDIVFAAAALTRRHSLTVGPRLN